MSTAISSTQVAEAFSTEMLAEQIQMMDESMQAMTKMMELSVNPSVGANFDMSV
ncbi:MAG: putative motility protein [Lachnospiraceae bacterium]|nr:putative motility protein [Lachnospiraceae bacterium]